MALVQIANLDPGLQCRNTLNAVIDLVGANHPWTPGSIPFTDGTGDFAQDNANFFWDATNKSLGISGSPALFKLPDVGGDNWFMAGAGNFAVSGFSNVGIGQQALIDLTSGRANLAIGSHTLQNCTTGRNNVGVGINVMSFLIAGEQNVGIGRAALDEQQDWNAVAIGDNALGNYDGPGSIGIGSNAAFNLNTGSKSIFIGYQCGSAITGPANRNVWLGGYSGSSGALSDTILFANGDGSIRALDYNFTSANTWTMTAGAALAFQGATSGTVKIDAKAVAGSWTFTLPDTAGTSGYVLSTNGSGVTSWIAGGGGGSMAIGGAITGGTASRVLFAGAGGVLDDDSALTWNDTLKDLAIGGAYYVGAERAVAQVLNPIYFDFYDNWFFAGAFSPSINPTGSGGFSNIGIGSQVMRVLTSGYENTIIGMTSYGGFSPGYNLTSGIQNVAIGASALQNVTTGSQNVAIGVQAMQMGSSSASGNTAIGFGAAMNLTTGIANSAIGNQALQATTVGNGNLALGAFALVNANGTGNTAIGGECFRSLQPGNDYNTGVGIQTGINWLTGTGNVLIGTQMGMNFIGGSNNTLIGAGFPGTATTVNDCIVFCDGLGHRLDYNFTAVGVWSVQSGPNAQAMHTYNTFTDSSNFECGVFDWQIASNVLVVGTLAVGTGVKRLTAIHGFAKAGAPASGDLPSGSYTVIDDTSAGQTWLVFNKAGTIRKVQLT